MTDDFEKQLRAVATVRDVARMVGLSPSRFYQLQQAGIFPPPVYDIVTRRPHYTEEQQRQCLEVRRRNCGINGKPILFYARRLDVAARPTRPRTRTSKGSGRADHAEIISGLKSLGLANVTAQEVQEAVAKVFLGGTTGLDPSEVVRKVFLQIKRRD